MEHADESPQLGGFPEDSAPRVAPPTVSPGGRPPAESAWPMALGMVAIVLGILGALGAVMGMVMAFAMRWYLGLFMGAMPPETLDAMVAATPHWAIAAPVQAMLLVAAVMLAMAGGRLVKRRQSGARLLRQWAIFKIILVVVSAIVGAMTAMAQLEVVGDAATPPPPGFGAVTMGMSLVGGLLWGWALPVFALVWLGRAKIRSEISGWAP